MNNLQGHSANDLVFMIQTDIKTVFLDFLFLDPSLKK